MPKPSRSRSRSVDPDLAAAVVCFIEWRDASYGMGDRSVGEVGLLTLREIGFLIAEDDEAITLSTEASFSESPTTRMYISIPKVNILR
jgi:hypothetical protein